MNLTYSSVGISIIIVIVAILIATYLKLGISREISIVSVRVFFQLLIMGYVLVYILQSEHILIVTLVLVGMALYGAFTSSKREKSIPQAFRISFISIFLGIFFTLGIVLAFGVIQIKAQYIIPIASMIIGSCMNATSLLMNRLKSEIRAQKQQIEAALCLGASSKQASELSLKTAIRASLIPSINRAATVGIVTLPGSMSGMIFAGISPIAAVKYQMLIEYVAIGSVAISVFCSAFFTYRQFFTKYHQLRDDQLMLIRDK